MESKGNPFDRKPKSLKDLQGTTRKDREEKNVPIIEKPTETPKPAPWVCATGKRVFRQLIDKLIEKGIFTELDLEFFNAGCHEYGTYIDMQKDLKKEGRTFMAKGTTSTGEIYNKGLSANPKINIANKAFAQAMSNFKLFGLNPTDRSKMHIPNPTPKEKKKDGIIGFINQRKNK
ncbi:phage terminase small subunit P27 family [Chondrinema litorale]|uniref:phage terminase small subunit P27 family n=1 Tax=Chondrinema litorale TaxID=2994555 RepID=UPI002542782E|nr:phage terminase small subunit P27 family [Chondrinema litorale]UZS00256.1 phage terminase small subunit P27 family [Chondrinema litorale]